MSNQHQPIQQQPNQISAPFPQLSVKPSNNPLQIKRNLITDDYSLTSQVLGMGINGRVLEIFHGESGEKYALKMLQDCPEARREVELHWRVSPCPHIVPIIDVYENIYQGRKCLLIVMEWSPGDLESFIALYFSLVYTDRTMLDGLDYNHHVHSPARRKADDTIQYCKVYNKTLVLIEGGGLQLHRRPTECHSPPLTVDTEEMPRSRTMRT